MAHQRWKWLLACGLLIAAPLGQTQQHVADFPGMDTGAASSIATPRPSVIKGRVVFIGDSYTQGAGGRGARWTTMFARREHWDEVNLGNGGTGYARAITNRNAAEAACGGPTCPNYLGAARNIAVRAPQVIVVSGGRDDLGMPLASVDANSTKLFHLLRREAPAARVFVVSPFWSATNYPAWLSAEASVLRRNAKAAGCTWLDVGSPLTGHPELIVNDGVHPTGAGYAVLARAVERAYDSAAPG